MKQSEENIIRGCRKGKAKAQKELYDLYASAMLGICLRYVKNKAEAEDVLQDGFVKVFKSIGSYSGDGSLSGWIYRIMVNTALNYLRSKKKIQFVEYNGNIQDSGEDVYAEPVFSRQQFMDAIQSLPDGYRTVFNLYVLEGYKHREIAEILDVSVNTSKTQLAKAREMLRKKLTAIQRKENDG